MRLWCIAVAVILMLSLMAYEAMSATNSPTTQPLQLSLDALFAFLHRARDNYPEGIPLTIQKLQGRLVIVKGKVGPIDPGTNGCWLIPTDMQVDDAEVLAIHFAPGAASLRSGNVIVVQGPIHAKLIHSPARWVYSIDAQSVTIVSPPRNHQSFTAPILVFSTLTLLLMCVVLSRWLRVRREGRILQSRLLGLCPGCRYDLRASIGRCPECGRAVPEQYGREG
jgi:hypothetical protein